MTRKRSNYKPRKVLRDTLAYVKAGLSPLTAQREADLAIRLRNHSSALAIYDGTAGSSDLGALMNVSNVAMAMKSLGKGKDWSKELFDAATALEAMHARLQRWGKVQATPGEREAISLMVRVHDAQLDQATIIDIERALKLVKKNVQPLMQKESE